MAIALLCSACTTLPDAAQLPVARQFSPAPLGYQSLCMDRPDLCDKQPPRVVHMEDWASAMEVINERVDRQIRAEKAAGWSPAGRGDCKTFATTKLEQLLQFDMPRGALHLAVAKVPGYADLHAVLLVSTDHGVYAMDSLRDSVEPWNDLPYSDWQIERVPGMLWSTDATPAEGPTP